MPLGEEADQVDGGLKNLGCFPVNFGGFEEVAKHTNEQGRKRKMKKKVQLGGTVHFWISYYTRICYFATAHKNRH